MANSLANKRNVALTIVSLLWHLSPLSPHSRNARSGRLDDAQAMKERYRLFLRHKSVYYAFDNTTKSFESLKTKDKAEAARMLVALNEAGKQPAMNLSLARVYLRHSDPMVSERTWQHVLDEIIKLKTGPTQYRWQSAAKDKAFNLIRDRVLIETHAEHLLDVLKKGTVSNGA